MEPQNTTPTTRQTAVNSLAIVGFVGLLAIGVWGAVYSSRYVPNIVGKIGTAAVYVGSIFSPAENPSVATTTPTPSGPTTIDFGPTTATTTATTTVAKPAATTTPKHAAPAPTYRAVWATTTPTYYGHADLAVSALAIGYLSSNSIDSFVVSPTVPDGKRPAVKFSVKNVGTMWTGTWNFHATLPTTNGGNYTSESQRSLNPGDSVDFTLGFDRADNGSNKIFTVIVNKGRNVSEVNFDNNTLTLRLDIK
jgi:hypothetical protein